MSEIINPFFKDVIDVSCLRSYVINLNSLIIYNSFNSTNTKVVIKSTTFPDPTKLSVSTILSDPNTINISPFPTIIDAIEYPGIVNGKTYEIVWNIQDVSNSDVGNIDGTYYFRYYIEEYSIKNTIPFSDIYLNNPSSKHLSLTSINGNAIMVKEVDSNPRVFTLDISPTGVLSVRPTLTFGINSTLAAISKDGNTVVHLQTASSFRFKEWNGVSYVDGPLTTTGANCFYNNIFREGIGSGSPGKFYASDVPSGNPAQPGSFKVYKIDNSNNVTVTSFPGIHVGSFYASRFKFFMSDDFTIVSSVTTEPGTYDLYVKVYEDASNTVTSTENWSMVGSSLRLTTGNTGVTPFLTNTFDFYSDPYDETSPIITRNYGDPRGAVTPDRREFPTCICKKDSNGTYHLMVALEEYKDLVSDQITFLTFMYFTYTSGGSWTYVSCLPNLLDIFPSLDGINNYGTHLEINKEGDRFYFSAQAGNIGIDDHESSTFIYFKRNSLTNHWVAYGNHSHEFLLQNQTPTTLTMQPANPTKTLQYSHTFTNKKIDTFFSIYHTELGNNDIYMALLDNSPPIARDSEFPTFIDTNITTTQLFNPKNGYGTGQNDYMNDNNSPTLIITEYDGINPSDVVINSNAGTFTINNLDSYPDKLYNIEYRWDNEFGVQGNIAKVSFILGTPVLNDDTGIEVVNNAISLIDVLANDSVIGGTLVIDTNTTGIVLSVVGNQIQVPSGVTNGTYNFTYDVEFSSVPTGSPATVYFTVVDPVVLNDITGLTYLNTVGGTVNVFSNDLGVSGRTLQILSDTSSSVSLISGGLISIPAGIPVGSYSFTYDVFFNGSLTGSPATVSFDIQNDPITLNDNLANEVEYTGGTIDVLSNDDLGQRNQNQVTVTIVNNISGPISVSVSNNQLVVPVGLPINSYTLDYDVQDSFNSNALTGSPATVTFDIIVSSNNGQLPAGNPLGLQVNSLIEDSNKVFVRKNPYSKDIVKQIFSSNYAGSNTDKIEEIIDKYSSNYIKFGNDSFNNKSTDSNYFSKDVNGVDSTITSAIHITKI